MCRLFWLILIPAAMLLSCSNNRTELSGSGLVEASDVIVSSETAGRLLNLYFGSGDDVLAGDTLGMIDSLAISLGMRQIEAVRQAAATQLNMARITGRQAGYNLTLAEKEFARASSLVESGSINRQAYDQVENAYRQAQLAVEQAEAAMRATEAEIVRIDAEYNLAVKQFNDCFPLAPMSGRIVEEYVDAGELLGPGSPIVKIARLDTVEVKIYLPPAELSRIKQGNRATIDPEDGQDNPLTGFVGWISSSAEFTPKNVQTREARADLVYAVKIKIPNSDERLKIGMPVTVTIEP